MRVDIAGAGIIGLSIAWRLAQAGYQVRVRDAGAAARQSSWAGAGMLAPAGEFRGESRWTRLAIESLAQYGEFVEELQAATGVAIDYRACGALELARDDGEKAALDAPRPEGIAMEEISLAAARIFAPIATSGIRAARWFPNEAVVDPRTVCDALLAACHALGVEIREHDPVTEPEGPTVIATGAWAPGAFPVKGHMLGYWRKKDSLPPIVRHGHHYALQRASGFTIFGSDEQRGVWDPAPEPDRVRELTAAAEALLPRLLSGPPDEVWAGLRPGSPAGEPVVEQVPGKDVWHAFGHYRNGILLAPVTARLVTEAIVSSLGKG